MESCNEFKDGKWVVADSLKDSGYKLRGNFLLWVVFIVVVISTRAYAPHEGVWGAVKEVAGMLLMIFVGIVISHHGRVWQKQVK